jgi:hypothetical protein
MIKHFTVLFLMLCISCTIRKNEFNQERFPISRFKLDQKENLDFYNLIDTSSIYISSSIRSFENLKNYNTIALKFYKNGRVAEFKNSFDDLASLDPKKAKMGVYRLDKNELEMEFLSHSAQAGYFLVRSKIKIKDELIFSTYGNITYEYVKKPLPSEFLVYKPDW